MSKQGIARVMESITRTKIAHSTINNIFARTAEAMRSPAMKIKKNVAKSVSVGFDGMMYKDNGIYKWITMMHNGEMYYFEIYNSSATRLLDGTDYKGVAVTDMYVVYKRFDKGGMHQYCRAHVLRYALYLFEKDDPTLSEAWRERRREYWEDLG